MRFDKFVCKCTSLNRTEAIDLIRSGAILVNGSVVVDESQQVHENNEIMWAGERLQPRPFRYLMFHKAADTICSNIDEAYPTLFNDLDIESASELHVAGRLDADTTGLVFITDDGRWTYNITRPEKACEKVYRVGLSSTLKPNVVDQFREGLQLQGEKTLTAPAMLDTIGEKEALLTITEGRYHQVKRMFAASGNRVVSLHREQIGRVRLDVPERQWRYLSIDEVKSF